MVKKFIIFTLLVMVFLLGFFALAGCDKVGDEKSELDVFYNIKVAIDTKTDTIYETTEVGVQNDTQHSIEKLYFYLYPNAYKDGGVQIGNVVSNGSNLKYNIDNINMEVTLSEPLGKGDRIELAISSRVSVPSGEGRMGKTKEGDYNLHAFYPRLAYFENGEFVLIPYSEIGDPYYFGEDDFMVSIEAPKEYKVAHSGEKIGEEEGTETLKTTFRIDNARDISLTLGKEFNVYEGETNGVKLYHYTRGESKIDFISECIEGLEELIGEYPYETFTVAETAYMHGGMEYSSFVNVNKNTTEKDFVILHELIHQWFGLSVGSNSFKECWVDESLTNYLTYYYTDVYKKGGYAEAIEKEKIYYRSFIKAGKKEYGEGYAPRINVALNEFRSLNEYSEIVYGYGVILYDGVVSVCGESNFIKAVKGYYKDYRGKIANGEELIESFSHYGTKKIGGVFESYLENRVTI